MFSKKSIIILACVYLAIGDSFAALDDNMEQALDHATQLCRKLGYRRPCIWHGCRLFCYSPKDQDCIKVGDHPVQDGFPCMLVSYCQKGRCRRNHPPWEKLTDSDEIEKVFYWEENKS